MQQNKFLGFNEELQKQHEKEEDYIFGASNPVKSEILVPNGDWRPFLPAFEKQYNNIFDTFSCTNFANNNVTEIINKCRYGEEINFSDRFSALISHTKPGVGNSHNNVAESRRKKGSVLENICPFTDSMSQRQFFEPVDDLMKDIGLQWLVDNEYNYLRVNRADFDEALIYSPIQIAVDAKTNRSDQVSQYNHSKVLIARDKKKGINYTFDSYPYMKDEYEWDYPFSYGMIFHYKKVLNIIIQDMKMRLIRNKETGAIYMVDSDGRKHHIETPTDFTEFFGQEAWRTQTWLNIDDKEVKAMPDGLNISAKKISLAEALANLFATLGKRVGNKK